MMHEIIAADRVIQDMRAVERLAKRNVTASPVWAYIVCGYILGALIMAIVT